MSREELRHMFSQASTSLYVNEEQTLKEAINTMIEERLVKGPEYIQVELKYKQLLDQIATKIGSSAGIYRRGTVGRLRRTLKDTGDDREAASVDGGKI